MTLEQLAIIILLLLTLGFFIWGRYRYDIVALIALIVATLVGLVPYDQAFIGFSHPAVITVAAILVVSKALMNSGLVDVIVRAMQKVGQNTQIQLLVLLISVTLVSGIMNNVGALALFMPVAIKMARKNEQSPSLYLMPLAFGSLLGGMMTLIGTPPNIILSSYRSEALDRTPFFMFDFFKVGGPIALFGITFIFVFGRFLIPHRKAKLTQDDLFEIKDYITEITITEKAKIANKKVREIERITKGEVIVIGHIREGERFKEVSFYRNLRPDDKIIVRAGAYDLQELLDATGLELAETHKLNAEALKKEDISVTEATITASSDMINRTVKSLNLRSRYNINLLSVARAGNRIRTTPSDVRLKAGDVLLLHGGEEALQEAVQRFSLLPLQERNIRIGKIGNVFATSGIFLIAILLAAFNILPVQIAFLSAAVLMVLFKFIALKELYESIDWPIIILLGALIPISNAFETTGTAQRITELFFGSATPLAPALTLFILIGITMLLSNVVNNAAAALLMAPIAVNIALNLNASIDPFLMAVAIGASAAFLTPIGHQSNTLVMGPGGYKFTDYTRLGIPLSLLIILIAVPLILLFWPL